ncbi:MAG: YdcF family protein [Candidatus Liptonbacteria bacterium]|nr:YdcF family protein [Candidatus Liptonbacteria bacterium]
MNEVDPGVLQLAEKIWNYHKLNQPLEKADVILVLGSSDLIVAEYAPRLFRDGWAPLLVCSGGLGALTSKIWHESEADKFAGIAIQMGVPQDKILIENRSANTGENILFTKELLKSRGIDPKKLILVQKPYMERRTHATFKKLWPEKDFVVTSPPDSFRDYLEYRANRETGRDLISVMVGDLQRIKLYPAKGFQVPQEIPSDVWDAYERLVQLGYTQHLVPE